MLIKDEVYVAAMLTSPEKYKRDRRRVNVNTAPGDKMIYKHHHRPEFEIFGRKIQFEWKSRDWQLRLMARARFLRRVLPGWHSREREFRDWYEQLVDQLQIRNRRDYERWLQILSTPGEVTGFRDIRYPKMERARQRAEQLLATDPEDIELPEEREARQQQEADSRVRLPILEGAGV
jgi:indolepyruvate ferredoxin oxidoreductase